MVDSLGDATPATLSARLMTAQSLQMQGRPSERIRSRARINGSRKPEHSLKLRPISARPKTASRDCCVFARLMAHRSYGWWSYRPCTGHVAGVPLFTRSLTRGGREEVDSPPFSG